jgi:hypothetical protein
VSFAVPLAAYAFIAMFALAARESAAPAEAPSDPTTSVTPIP